MNIVHESYAIKTMRCSKCGWTPHRIYPLTRKAVCTFCHDPRDIRPHEAEAETVTHGGPERNL